METTPIMFGEVDMKPLEPVVEAGGSRSIVHQKSGREFIIYADRLLSRLARKRLRSVYKDRC